MLTSSIVSSIDEGDSARWDQFQLMSPDMVINDQGCYFFNGCR